jgi:AAA family ATP:ADP antiporter
VGRGEDVAARNWHWWWEGVLIRFARWTERLLNLRKGDLGLGALFFLYLCFITGGYIVGLVARDALFLAKFRPDQLPYVDIAVAGLVGFVVAGYVRVGRHAELRGLLMGSLLFFALSLVAFWWLESFHRLPWLAWVLYGWVGIVGVLAPAQVWTLANYVFTTREAKRMFGLIGSGGITGAIFGGFLASAAVRRFGTESLLLAMAALLAVCSLLVLLIARKRRSLFTAAGETQKIAPSPQGPRNLLESFRRVRASTHLQAIAALICISSIATNVASWQFRAMAKHFYPEKDMLAAFLGTFQGYAGAFSLVVQLALTSRLLRKFGVGPTLFVLPIALVAGTGGVMVWGTLWSAIFLYGSDKIFRHSVDRSTVELLYLPVPSAVKMQAKSFIDTVIWRMGDGMAGLTLLIFANYLRFSPRQISWVNLVVLAGWISAAYVAGRRYVSTLSESIQQHRLDAERTSAPVLDRSSTDLLATNLAAANADEILYALSLLEMDQRQAVHPAVRGLLEHGAPEVRRKAVSILAAAGDTSVRPQVERLMHDPDPEVRTEVLLYLAHLTHIDPLARMKELGDVPDFSIRSGMVSFLARPGPTQSLATAELILDEMVKQPGAEGKPARLEAARLLGELPDQFDTQFRLLLADADAEVARHAIRAVGNLRARRFVPRVIERLGDAELAPAAVEALAQLGDRIVGTLRDHLSDPGVPLAVRREIPAVLAGIGTQAAEYALVENLLEGDSTLRFRIIAGLNKVHQQNPELKLDEQMIETVLAAEIMGHYRSYQILETMGGNLESDDSVVKALRESMEQEVERIFRLLGLLFPRRDFHSAYVGLQSSNAVVHDNALEFLDSVLKPQLRKALVPLLDREVSVAERVRLASHLVGTRVESPEEAVIALVRSEDAWLKSCGAYAIGTLGLRSLAAELESCLNHHDPLLRETARQAKLRLESREAGA